MSDEWRSVARVAEEHKRAAHEDHAFHTEAVGIIATTVRQPLDTSLDAARAYHVAAARLAKGRARDAAKLATHAIARARSPNRGTTRFELGRRASRPLHLPDATHVPDHPTFDADPDWRWALADHHRMLEDYHLESKFHTDRQRTDHASSRAGAERSAAELRALIRDANDDDPNRRAALRAQLELHKAEGRSFKEAERHAQGLSGFHQTMAAHHASYAGRLERAPAAAAAIQAAYRVRLTRKHAAAGVIQRAYRSSAASPYTRLGRATILRRGGFDPAHHPNIVHGRRGTRGGGTR